jgi:molybdate transport system substrate-binding protein
MYHLSCLILQFRNKYIFFSLLAGILFLRCSGKSKTESQGVTIFCASGLSSYILELADSLKAQGINTTTNIASTGILARQIVQGNQADFFISANKTWASYIDSAGFADTVIQLGKNELVLVAPLKSNLSNLDEVLENARRICLGSPEFVPAGYYTLEVLKNLNQFDKIKDRLIYTQDVKSALQLVELGECDAGFVYKSDALFSKKTKIIDSIAETLHPPINFYLVGLKTHSPYHQKVFEFLISKESASLLKKNGLMPILH